MLQPSGTLQCHVTPFYVMLHSSQILQFKVTLFSSYTIINHCMMSCYTLQLYVMLHPSRLLHPKLTLFSNFLSSSYTLLNLYMMSCYTILDLFTLPKLHSSQTSHCQCYTILKLFIVMLYPTQTSHCQSYTLLKLYIVKVTPFSNFTLSMLHPSQNLHTISSRLK